MMKNYSIKTETPEKTYAFGEALGALLKGDETILLLGGMGAGKTALTRGIVAGMGIDDDVSSPTYTLVNTYEGDTLKVHHFDLYRLTDPDSLYEMGFEDYLDDDAVLLIEWPQIAEGELFRSPWTIEILQTEDLNTRILQLNLGSSVIDALEQAGW